jgi:hypothetical protein
MRVGRKLVQRLRESTLTWAAQARGNWKTRWARLLQHLTGKRVTMDELHNHRNGMVRFGSESCAQPAGWFLVTG